ncbi:TPA: hypothetical protein PX230_001264 [Escherichia coli]|uniref:hypothetical protein n=1 Tax=Escherichia coli TaxID=562 RepID=UPI001C5F9919|nr:hypothetical protein [Escherichia coli]HCJ9609227.1 hypothetical protein [Escherichia coli]HDL8927623.1 hypothetical protein [Escherichia coli]
MKSLSNSKNFSHWTIGTSGTGVVASLSDGRLRMQTTDTSSRAFVYRDITLSGGDTVTIYGIGKTTSLSSGNLIMGVEYPVGTRKMVSSFTHNEDSRLHVCSWKVPAEYGQTTVRIMCGLTTGTTAIAYMTDLWFEVDSVNLGSRRILMDGVLEIAAGVSSISTNYERSNVGTVNSSGINIDISPLSYTAGDRRPIAFVQQAFNSSETYTNGLLVPVCNFTSGGVLNIRLLNPTTGSTVGVTGSTIYKTLAFTVYT